MGARFVLNGEVRTADASHASAMLLPWLRETAGLTGTKEGCAEGDCGACTVALGELDATGERIRWQAVNACILFLGAVHGKAVLTVEGIAAADGDLHPVQRAMVEQHASQCGFCTPGFVMTLFAHQRRGGGLDRVALDEALAGNLCRCTGYRPIVDAARAAAAFADGDDAASGDAETVARLRRLADEPTDGGDNGFTRPRSVDELARRLEAQPEALLVAGGTDAGLWVTKDLRTWDRVVTTAFVAELRTIRTADRHLEIGSAATYTDLLPHLDARWPAFGRMLRRLGSELIRNSATLAGNLGSASPIGDALPVLLALDASLVLRRGSHEREVAVADYFLSYKRTLLQPGEFIVQIRLPLPAADQRLHVEKVSKRFDQDISAVLVAVAVGARDGRLEDCRVALGGMAAIPVRTVGAEAVLEGAAPTAAAFAAAAAALADDVAPISDMRATARYRLDAAQAALIKCGMALRGEAIELPRHGVEVAA